MPDATVEFYYDIQCPWAYIASRRIEAIAGRAGARIIWKPVLLGGIYEATKAPQGKSGSATDVMPQQKKDIHKHQFQQTLARYNVTLNFHPNHPVRTLDAVRLLHATPQEHRPALTHAFYSLYWIKNADLTDQELLLKTASDLNIPYSVTLDKAIFSNPTYSDSLRNTTGEAVQRGAPGVPFFWVGSKDAGAHFWGQDRLHFVEASLLSLRATGAPDNWDKVENILRVYPRVDIPRPISRNARRKLTFFFDFSSPWSYIGFTQMGRILKEAGDDVEIEWVPIIVGALFREIGTPMLPLSAMSEARRNYSAKDMLDWTRFWRAVLKQSGEDPNKVDATVVVNWPTKFPIRSVLPLKVALLEPSLKLKEAIYKAGWVNDIDVSDPSTLATVLTKAQFDGPSLVAAAQENKGNVKERLRENNRRAVAEGVCGVPSWIVEIDGVKSPIGVIWGQDQLNVVADLLQGWDISTPTKSKM